MFYEKIFELRGTERQKEIVREALDQIKFPWHRITPPRKVPFIIGWANLNGAAVYQDPSRLHVGDHPATDTDTEKIEGEIGGRKYILGVFYPSTGNIYIDNFLVHYPGVAKSTVSAEIAHLVDEFLPLTDQQRREINTLAHNGEPCDHTWWEVADYGKEYFTLVGEAFMNMFTRAYSNMTFNDSSFTHRLRDDQLPTLRKIIGIERVDYVAPVEPVKEPVKEPEPAPVVDVIPEKPAEPEPEPVVQPKEPKRVKHFERGVYHDLAHIKKREGKEVSITTAKAFGWRPCKTCERKYDL